MKTWALCAVLWLGACGKATQFDFTMNYAASGAEKITNGTYVLASAVTGGESTWPSFTAEARKNCGGNAPKSIEIVRIELNLVEATAVEDLGEVFSTGVTVWVTPSNVALGKLTTIGTVTGVHGTGPILFKVTPLEQLKEVTTDLINGTVLLGIQGDTIREPSDVFSIKLRIALSLETKC